MQEFLSALLQAVLIAAVPVLSAFAAKGFVALAQYLGVKAENATFAKYTDQIGKAVSTAVIYVAQTYVDELKKSGTFTEENQKIALQEALNVAKKQLTQEALEFIEMTYGDATEYLISKLEAEVKIQKTAPAVLNIVTEN